MHELAITENMLDLVLKEAKEAGGSKVGKINLVIGEMSGVVADSVKFYFGFLSKETPAEGAELSIIEVPIKARCLVCGKHCEPKDFNWVCPDCGSNRMKVVSGEELFVESIEVE